MLISLKAYLAEREIIQNLLPDDGEFPFSDKTFLFQYSKHGKLCSKLPQLFFVDIQIQLYCIYHVLLPQRCDHYRSDT